MEPGCLRFWNDARGNEVNAVPMLLRCHARQTDPEGSAIPVPVCLLNEIYPIWKLVMPSSASATITVGQTILMGVKITRLLPELDILFFGKKEGV